MTDLPANLTAVPSRLGSTAGVDERGLVIEINDIQTALLHHGVLRLSVLSFIVDVSAGVTLDTDPHCWTFTTDLSLRMQANPAPRRVEASTTILRRGRRSAHGTGSDAPVEVRLTDTATGRLSTLVYARAAPAPS